MALDTIMDENSKSKAKSVARFKRMAWLVLLSFGFTYLFFITDGKILILL